MQQFNDLLKSLPIINIKVKELRKEKSTPPRPYDKLAIEEGGRNDHVYKKACYYRDKGLDFNEALELCMLDNQKTCIPPLDIQEVTQVVQSCFNNVGKPEEIGVISLEQLYDDSNFCEPIPLVHNLINKSEFHLCSATAKTGKTLLQLNLASSIARGTKFLEHFETEKGRVLVVQTEVSNNQLRKRVMKIFGDDVESIFESVHFVNKRIKIDTHEGLESLKNLINTLKPDLVILDPFYTLHNKNEDSSTDMAPVLSDLRELVLETEVSLLLIHHQGKTKESNAQTGHKHRGSSSFADVPDGSWSLQKSGTGDYLTLSFEMRNIESPGPYQVLMDNEDLTFVITNEINPREKGLSVLDVVEFIYENPGLNATSLKKELSVLYEVSARTVGTRISDAVVKSKIYKKKEGRETKYYLIEETSNPLGGGFPFSCPKETNDEIGF